MSKYEQLPTDFLLKIYTEVNKNIENGKVSKNLYYELGLIIAEAEKRGITLGQTEDFHGMVDQQIFFPYLDLVQQQNNVKDSYLI